MNLYRVWIVMVVLFFGTLPVFASNYHVGYVFSDKYGTYTFDGQYWNDAFSNQYTLREWQEWSAYYCKYVTRYEYIRVHKPVVINNVKAKDFWERLADNLAEKEETDKRYSALQTFYGQGAAAGYPGAFNQKIDLYGGQFSIQQQQYAPIDLNVALLQLGLTADAINKSGPQVFQLYSQSVDKLAEQASRDADAKNFREYMLAMKRANLPAATIQQNIPNGVQVLPAQPQANVVDLEGNMAHIRKKAVIAKDRLKAGVDPKMHMPQGGHQMSEDEIRMFVFGNPKEVKELDLKFKCTECHSGKGVAYTPK